MVKADRSRSLEVRGIDTTTDDDDDDAVRSRVEDHKLDEINTATILERLFIHSPIIVGTNVALRWVGGLFQLFISECSAHALWICVSVDRPIRNGHGKCISERFFFSWDAFLWFHRQTDFLCFQKERTTCTFRFILWVMAHIVQAVNERLFGKTMLWVQFPVDHITPSSQ